MSETSILLPSRIQTLGSYPIHIHEYGTQESKWVSETFPFDTVQTVKDRISAHHNDNSWSSEYLYIATKAADGSLIPLEFAWPFAKTLPFPLETQGIPTSELVEGNIRKVVSATFFTHVTLETLGSPTELHVWRLKDLADGIELTDAVLGGYIQLYFPHIRKVTEVEKAMSETSLSPKKGKSTSDSRYLSSEH